MIPSSLLFRDALSYSRTVSARVDIVRNGVVVGPNVPCVGGTVTCDTTRVVRWECSLGMALTPWQDIDVNTADTRVRVYVGLQSLGIAESLQVGEYRVNDVSRTEVGQVTVTGEGLESYVRDDRFEQPRTPPYGTSTVIAIGDLVQQAVPGGATMVLRNSRNRGVLATAPWEKERLDAVDALSESLQAVTYADHAGRFVIEDLPDLGGVPVAILDEGAGGLLIARSEKISRTGVFNAAVVSGSSTDSTVPPVSAVARNTNPASPTRWGGPFGKVPTFMTSQFLTTVEQCQAAADRKIAEGEAADEQFSIDGVPLVYLTGGDLVWVRRSTREMAVALLTKTTLDIGVAGRWSAEVVTAPTYADVP